MAQKADVFSRRAALAAGLGVACSPAFAQSPTCVIGPPPHEKGPKVFLDYDQIELDAAWNQVVYAPTQNQIQSRFTTNTQATIARLGKPLRFSYGPTAVEGLDVYPARKSGCPIFVFVHGGRWLLTAAKDYGFPADLFVDRDVNYVVLDFIQADAAKGDLRIMVDQVRRAIAWTYQNADKFNADRSRLYVGGHSSGGQLCGCALVTDWTSFGVPADFIKGGLLMSGAHDLQSARLSGPRSAYVAFDDDMVQSLSPQRHIQNLRAPVIVTYGTLETPEFQRQSRDLAAAIKAAGKPVELIEAKNFNHFEMCDSLGNPYGPNGLAARKLMQLG